MGLIDPDAIPGRTLEPEQVEASATALGRIGRGVRHSAASVSQAWHGLSDCYQAPEAGLLLTAVRPVMVDAATFDSQMRVAGTALTDLARDLRPIKTELGRIRAEAADFVARVGHGVLVQRLVAHEVVHKRVPWDLDPATVEQNNALVARVDQQVQLLAAAEEACALRIYGAVGEARCGAAGEAPRSGWRAPLASSAAPWGAPVELRQDCLGSIGYGILDGAVASVRNLAALEGWDPQSRRLFVDGQASADALTGLGQLAFGAATLGPLALGLSRLQGPVGDLSRSGMAAMVSAARGLSAFDMWSRDPARAAGQVLFNIGTFALPIRGAGLLEGSGEAVSAARLGLEAAPDASAIRPSVLSDPLAALGSGGQVPKVLSHRVVLTLEDVRHAGDPLRHSVQAADLRAIHELIDADKSTPALTVHASHDVPEPVHVPVREPVAEAGHDVGPSGSHLPKHHSDSREPSEHREVDHQSRHSPHRGREHPSQPSSKGEGGGEGSPPDPNVSNDHLTRGDHDDGLADDGESEPVRNVHLPHTEQGTTAAPSVADHHSVGGERRLFVGTGRGSVYPIPEGWTQEMARNNRGLVFQKLGSMDNNDIIRIAEPTTLYPDGYVRLYNEFGQPIDIYGKPGSPTATHVSQLYKGDWPSWPE